MSNASATISPSEMQLAVDPEVFKIPWLVGLAASCGAFLSQLALYAALPSCRKYDEKVLLQLTMARILNTVCEYCIVMDLVAHSVVFKNLVFVVCLHTDFALVCWMFAFSKNLYDKVVSVFPPPKFTFCTVALCIWLLTLPVGLMCPVFLTMGADYFYKYYKTYAFVKFLVVSVNALMFVEVFSVVFSRGLNSSREVKDWFKAALVGSCLVCMTSAQVLVTDLLSLVCGELEALAYVFCVINSFQGVLMAIIFAVLVNRKIKESMRKSVPIRLTEIVI